MKLIVFWLSFCELNENWWFFFVILRISSKLFDSCFVVVVVLWQLTVSWHSLSCVFCSRRSSICSRPIDSWLLQFKTIQLILEVKVIPLTFELITSIVIDTTALLIDILIHVHSYKSFRFLHIDVIVWNICNICCCTQITMKFCW